MTDTQAPIQTKPDKRLEERKTSLKNMISQFAPKGIDALVYYDLVSKQIMGTDAKGNPRPLEDMLFFLNVAKKLELDPSLRQIYPVYRWDSKQGKERMIIQTGIDGFRLVAQRSKEYGGQDDATFTVEEVYNPITGEMVKQLKATVTVYKIVKGTRMPVTASARWHEYAQKGKAKDGADYYMGLWATMPYNQLAKCAEALALRKAFPQDLSGVYIGEEMDKERGDIRTLDLPTPKSIEDKKQAKESAATAEKVADARDPQPAKVETGKAADTLISNFDKMKS